MDTNKLKLCVICCSAFSSASIVESDAVVCREHLLSFCKLLANSPPKQTKEFEDLVQKSFPGMDDFFVESGMSVCVDCHHQITLAIQKGAESEKKEEEVQKLQKQILQQMKDLQKQLDEFHEEMNKVEKVIQTSDVSCLMYHMAQNPSKNESATNAIVLIRDRILDVMTDLRDFQSRQNNMLNIDLEKLLKMIGGGGTNDADDDGYLPFIPEPEIVIGTNGLLEAGINPMFFGHTIFGNDGDYRFEANEKVNHGDDGGNDTDYSVDTDEGTDSDDSNIKEEPFPLMGHQIIEPKHYQDSTFDVRAQVAALNGTLAPEVHLQSNSDPPLSSSSDFKKAIIDRVRKRQKVRDPKLNSNLDPFVRYTIIYCEKSEQLTFKNYVIKINQSARALECTKCGYSCREKASKTGNFDVEWKIKAHIMSAHVGFFCLDEKCRYLPKYSSHHYLMRHIRDKHLIPSLTKSTKSDNHIISHMLISGMRENESSQPSTPQKKKFEPRQGTRKSSRHKSPSPKATTPTPPLSPKPSTSKASSSSSQITVFSNCGPKPSPKASTSATSLPSQGKAIPGRGSAPPLRSSPPLKQRSSVSSTAKIARMCPVSACRKMFSEKEEFIKHLQEHRKQSTTERVRQMKMKLIKPKPVSNSNEEPEVVTLD